MSKFISSKSWIIGIMVLFPDSCVFWHFLLFIVYFAIYVSSSGRFYIIIINILFVIVIRSCRKWCRRRLTASRLHLVLHTPSPTCLPSRPARSAPGIRFRFTTKVSEMIHPNFLILISQYCDRNLLFYYCIGAW